MEIELPDNVVQLRTKNRAPDDLPVAPVREPERGKGAAPPKGVWCCEAHMFVLDEHARTVHCSRCEKVFDGFEAMLAMSRVWKRYDFNHRDAARELRDMNAQIVTLKRQIKNLKARVRTATPAIVGVAGKSKNTLLYAFMRAPSDRKAALTLARDGFAAFDTVIAFLEGLPDATDNATETTP